MDKIKQQGKQRASFTTCMVCWDRIQWHKSWVEEPCDVINRDSRGHQPELHLELQALTVLWQEHREEFDAILASLRDVDDLAQHRRQRRRRL